MLTNKIFSLTTVLLILLLKNTPTATSTEVAVLKENATEVVSLQNEVVSFKFLPAESGTCSTFEIKNENPPFVLCPGTILLQEIFTSQTMETGKSKIPYQYNVVEKGPDRGVIEFIAMLDSGNADETVAGLQLKKRVTLSSNKRYLEIEQIMFNPTGDFFGARIGNRHKFVLGEAGQEVFFLPTERNVLKITDNSINHFYAKMYDWDYQPAAGWMAIVNTKNKQGFVFVMDYNFLDAFYTKNASGECGWFVDGGILKPGTTFTTSYILIPIMGFSGVVHSSRRLIADVEIKPLLDKTLEITHILSGGISHLGNVTVKTSVYGIRSKEITTLNPIILENVGFEPVSKTIHFDHPQKEPIVLRVEVSGESWQESYEAYYEGKFQTTIYPGYPYVPEYRCPKPKKVTGN